MNIVRRLFGIGFSFAGVMHFVRSEGFEAIVPNYLPFKKAIVWITGVMEIVFGIMLIIKKPSSLMKKINRMVLSSCISSKCLYGTKEHPIKR